MRLIDGQSRTVLAAANVVLVASGTATLETLLSQRPMVVAYRVAPFTAFLLRDLGLVKVAHFAQPNLLTREPLVPEFFQEAVTPSALAAAIRAWVDDPVRVAAAEREFATVHAALRRDGARAAATAVLELVDERGDR